MADALEDAATSSHFRLERVSIDPAHILPDYSPVLGTLEPSVHVGNGNAILLVQVMTLIQDLAWKLLQKPFLYWFQCSAVQTGYKLSECSVNMLQAINSRCNGLVTLQSRHNPVKSFSKHPMPGTT